MTETAHLGGEGKTKWRWRWGTRKPTVSRPVKRSPLGVDATALRIYAFSAAEIERMLRGNAHDVQRTALRALTIARCPESLACLLLLFQVEDAETDGSATTLYARLVDEYASPDADSQVCFSASLTQRLLDGCAPQTDTVAQVKQYLLSDLRFNPLLMRVLVAHCVNA